MQNVVGMGVVMPVMKPRRIDMYIVIYVPGDCMEQGEMQKEFESKLSALVFADSIRAENGFAHVEDMYGEEIY